MSFMGPPSPTKNVWISTVFTSKILFLCCGSISSIPEPLSKYFTDICYFMLHKYLKFAMFKIQPTISSSQIALLSSVTKINENSLSH